MILKWLLTSTHPISSLCCSLLYCLSAAMASLALANFQRKRSLRFPSFLSQTFQSFRSLNFHLFLQSQLFQSQNFHLFLLSLICQSLSFHSCLTPLLFKSQRYRNGLNRPTLPHLPNLLKRPQVSYTIAPFGTAELWSQTGSMNIYSCVGTQDIFYYMNDQCSIQLIQQ